MNAMDTMQALGFAKDGDWKAPSARLSAMAIWTGIRRHKQPRQGAKTYKK